uniref:IMP-specific 5'-nucleotidase 1 n=1 Tax=Grammatophora oceanica TaxID=210454 RepID=A0A7S1VEI8_9STRA
MRSYLGIPIHKTIHVGDQFLNTGNDYLARGVCPCIWITGPEETTYILKSILRLAGIDAGTTMTTAAAAAEGETLSSSSPATADNGHGTSVSKSSSLVDFSEVERRTKTIQLMDVYTGEILNSDSTNQPKV